jgi:biofilm PGA synthesis N-glycosyltransferase PgaC
MTFYDYLYSYIFLYPSLMAIIWICGGTYYYFHWERQYLKISKKGVIELPLYPKISIMIPCYNEEANIAETINQIRKQNYPNFEIIAINDGSQDNTARLLEDLAKYDDRLIVLHQKNHGKATALNHGLSVSSGDYLVCIDGDALLDKNACRWFIRHFLEGSNVGAVTGNPRVRTRTSIVGKLQTGEFSSIIGLVKRAQRIYGTIFTVSGVIVAFRKTALENIKGWSHDMITEDIDVSWKLQINDWQIRYEPLARCWVLMPETVRGLFTQRLRWAQGGAEVFFKYFFEIIKKRKSRFLPLLVEYVTSIIWCYSILLGFLISFLQILEITDHYSSYQVILISWASIVSIFICLLQFATSIVIERHYDSNLVKNLVWCIWYPIAYWAINMITVIIAFPKAMFRTKDKKATWTSPDRGEAFNNE